MSQAANSSPGPFRHPLGLPAGSIRSLLCLLILGLFWLLLIVPEQPGKAPVQVPLAVYCLLALVLHFFGSHGHSIGGVAGQPSPWHLPRGTIRLIIVLGTLTVVGYEYHLDSQRMLDRLTPSPDHLKDWPYLVGALGGGFCFGLLLRLGPWKRLPAYQDLLAWISLAAVLLLVAYFVLTILINPTISVPIDALTLECILIAAASCYFGARS